MAIQHCGCCCELPCAVCEEYYCKDETNDVDAYVVCDYCIDELGCLGIEIEDGVFSGCDPTRGNDCPNCSC